METESELTALVDQLPQLVWFALSDGYHDYFNRRWYDFTGLSPEKSLGWAWRSAVHPVDLPKVTESFETAVASGDLQEVEYRLRSAAGHYCWVLSRGIPSKGPSGEITRWVGTCTIIDAQKQAEYSCRVIEEQYRIALDAAKLGTWRFELDSGMVSWDEGSCALFDLPANGLMIMPLEQALERIHPDDRDNVRVKIAAAIASDSSGRFEVECRTILDDNSMRWTRSTGQLFFSEDNTEPRIAGLSGVVRDITAERSASQAQELLTRELTHRVKNLFAITNGMVSMTARTARDTKEMALALRGRLGALSRAHELVHPVTPISKAGAQVGLDKLIEVVLAPYTQEGGDQVQLEGPFVSVAANTATSLSLVLHELATNAAKYGSLSGSQGRLALQWAKASEVLTIVWRETGGPQIEAIPTFEGFGSQLTQRSVTGQLGGTIAREWLPEGLSLRITIPLDRLSL